MSSIQLDLKKLLGFKILSKEASPSLKNLVLGAKLGGKPGAKPTAAGKNG